MPRGPLAGTTAVLVLSLAVSTWVVHRASAQSTPGSSFNGQPLDGTISGVVINDSPSPVSMRTWRLPEGLSISRDD